MLNQHELEVFNLILSVATFHGYIVCVYGSTLIKENPRDLDLMLVPKRFGTVPDGVFNDLVNLHDFKSLTKKYDGIMGTSSRIFNKDGLIVDMQIRND